MSPGDGFIFYPIGAALAQTAERWETLSRIMETMPRSIRDMLISPQTASFIRGMIKTHNLPHEAGYHLAYLVSRVAVGEVSLAQLQSVMATELKLPLEQAAPIAREIEKELFVPIMLEFNQYLAARKSGAPPRTSSAVTPAPPLRPAAPTAPPPTTGSGARNVLDLKSQPRPPVPPRIPKK